MALRRIRKSSPPGPGGRDKRPAGRPTTSGRVTPKPSGRYTPPIPREYKVSPRWVPVLILVFLIGGMLVIVTNYMGKPLPGSPRNLYLFLGLGMITAGFITATRYR